MISNPYKILGVSPAASDDEIKKTYRKLAKKYHPDLNPGNQEAVRKMSEINTAYEQLKNRNSSQGRDISFSSRETPTDTKFYSTKKWKQFYRKIWSVWSRIRPA